MALLCESWVEKDEKLGIYKFYDETTRSRDGVITFDSMRQFDDTRFYKDYILKRDPVTQFVYKYGIGDKVQAIRTAKTPRALEDARYSFMKSASYYVMHNPFLMVVKGDRGEDVIVRGDLRVSGHGVSPEKWQDDTGHYDFGISIVLQDSIAKRTFIGNKHARIEIWEYAIGQDRIENALALIKRLSNRKTPVTMDECDSIMGMHAEVITDGDNNIDSELNVFVPKKKEEPIRFTYEDTENEKGLMTDRKTGETFDTFSKYDRRWAVVYGEDEMFACLVKTNGTVARDKQNMHPIEEGRRSLKYLIHEMVRSAIFERKIKGIIKEALNEALR